MSPIDLIRTYRISHPGDEAIHARFRRFVEAHPDCLERSLTIGHVTASAWVVDASGRNVVLVHHRKLDRWLQPGGHVDGCADLEASARREVLEETGLTNLIPCRTAPFDLDIHLIPAQGRIAAHEHYDVRFAFRLEGRQPLRGNHESHEVLWVEIDRLEDNSPDPSLLRMRDKWRTQEVASDRPDRLLGNR